ncbi:phosphoenolpyruvate carboxykinase (ATP) [Tuberibacillus sp. Marseille-P3662]|uniref:phosphoenolpyruvate carboxykinase (ATP) n=1 Tax=Tuberibacillus sp. Marseille-P3662 TaxID=1965358 RepID=UPI000A1C866C|nr:phosphoenolpyruvate carboxykinase (ATP) [Tuberibacillus sp. Marseille-P3662]
MSTTTFSSKLHELLQNDQTHFNWSISHLIEKSLVRQEGILSETGALAVKTGKYTGRSPYDKYIVNDIDDDRLDWKNNQPMNESTFLSLYEKVLDHLTEQQERFVFRGFAGTDPQYALPIQVITEYSWHNLFSRQLFVRPENETETIEPAFTVISAPSFKADPVLDGTRSEAFIAISFKHNVVLIGGTQYAGEIKKSIFSVMNALLPQQDILSMHCSANIGNEGDVALFFGLSGTGKTTLSNHPNRQLIGDDEHGWSDAGVFNIEGGCYAKTIRLSQEKEPLIWQAIRYGSVLENVEIDANSRVADYDSNHYTENTRAAYPIQHVPNVIQPSRAGHPETIIFLTADAFGVLPPISRLSKEQAMYHYLSGYTSKLAGTERGVTTPEATFSTCFGAPFLPLKPSIYANMLGQRIDQHHVNVYLVNTGWIGGPYGEGERIDLNYTRAMVQAALTNELKHTETDTEPYFGLSIPTQIPGVPDNILFPKATWTSETAYDQKANALAQKFKDNFTTFKNIDPAIAQAGPK